MKECIFCLIGQGKDKQTERKIFENKKFFCFLTLNPKTKGHALLVTKKHFSSLGEMPESDLKEFFRIGVKIADEIKDRLGAKAFTLKANNEVYRLAKNAGHIGHVHLHIILYFFQKEVKERLSLKESERNLNKVKSKILKKGKISV